MNKVTKIIFKQGALITGVVFRMVLRYKKWEVFEITLWSSSAFSHVASSYAGKKESFCLRQEFNP